MNNLPRNFGIDEKSRLTALIKSGMQVLGEVSALNEGLSETVKAVAEELELNPAILKKCIKTAFKNDFDKVEADVSLLEEILKAAGQR